MHWLFIACGAAFNITICNYCDCDCDCDCDVQHQKKYNWPVIVLKLGSCWKCLFHRDLQLKLTKLAKIRFHHRTILNGEIKRFSEHLEITIQFRKYQVLQNKILELMISHLRMIIWSEHNFFFIVGIICSEEDFHFDGNHNWSIWLATLIGGFAEFEWWILSSYWLRLNVITLIFRMIFLDW